MRNAILDYLSFISGAREKLLTNRKLAGCYFDCITSFYGIPALTTTVSSGLLWLTEPVLKRLKFKDGTPWTSRLQQMLRSSKWKWTQKRGRYKAPVGINSKGLIMRKSPTLGGAVGRWGSIGGRVLGWAMLITESAIINKCVWDCLDDKSGRCK